MRKAGRLLFVFFISLLALASVKPPPPVSADTRVSGVATGQFLHYDYPISSSGNDTVVLNYFRLVQAWLNVTVLDVSNANVTFRQVIYNITAIRSDNTYLLDVATGYAQIVHGSSVSAPFENILVAANLNAGDPVILQPGAPTINETVITSYLGSQFETNNLTAHTTTNNASAFGLTVNVSETKQWHWERRTGIFMDFQGDANFSRSDGAGGVLTAHAHTRVLILSAVPPLQAVPEFASLLILPPFVIATLVAVAAHKRRPRSNAQASKTSLASHLCTTS